MKNTKKKAILFIKGIYMDKLYNSRNQGQPFPIIWDFGDPRINPKAAHNPKVAKKFLFFSLLRLITLYTLLYNKT